MLSAPARVRVSVYFESFGLPELTDLLHKFVHTGIAFGVFEELLYVFSHYELLPMLQVNWLHLHSVRLMVLSPVKLELRRQFLYACIIVLFNIRLGYLMF